MQVSTNVVDLSLIYSLKHLFYAPKQQVAYKQKIWDTRE